MLASFDQNSAAAKQAFCGLEAEVYSPRTGKTVTLYIADAFDDKWVRTPSSIDVLFDSVRSACPSSLNYTAPGRTTRTTWSKRSGGG